MSSFYIKIHNTFPFLAYTLARVTTHRIIYRIPTATIEISVEYSFVQPQPSSRKSRARPPPWVRDHPPPPPPFSG